MTIKTTARVQLVVEVDLPDHWAESCPTSQVFTEASRDAHDGIQKLLLGASTGDLALNGVTMRLKARIVGAPKTLAVFTEEAP